MAIWRTFLNWKGSSFCSRNWSLLFSPMAFISSWRESHMFTCLFLSLNYFFGLSYHPDQFCIFPVSFQTVFLGLIFLPRSADTCSCTCPSSAWGVENGAAFYQEACLVFLSVWGDWLLCSLFLYRLLPVSAYFSFSWTLVLDIVWYSRDWSLNICQPLPWVLPSLSYAIWKTNMKQLTGRSKSLSAFGIPERNLSGAQGTSQG